MMKDIKPILVVDDEQIMRDLLSDYLEMLDLVVDIAKNGQEAIDIIKNNGKEYYSLIITDINMPIKGGIELYDFARSFSPATKVIFMSGYGIEKVKEEVHSAEGFLPKPFELDSLTTTISELLGVDLQ